MANEQQEPHRLSRGRETQQTSNQAAGRSERQRIEARERPREERQRRDWRIRQSGFQRNVDGQWEHLRTMKDSNVSKRHYLGLQEGRFDRQVQELFNLKSRNTIEDRSCDESEKENNKFMRRTREHRARVDERKRCRNEREARALAPEAGRQVSVLDTAAPVRDVHDPRTSGPHAGVTEAGSIELPGGVPTTTLNDVIGEPSSES